MQKLRRGMLFRAKAIDGVTVPHITKATPADAGELSELHAVALPPGWSAEALSAYCGQAARIVLKAVDISGLLGFAVLQFAADEAEILTIAVRRANQNQGVGSQLMRAAVALFQERSVSHVYLEVEEGNAPALALYEKSGFRIFARRHNYYRKDNGGATTALIMRLDIRSGLSHVEAQNGNV